jgi:hypothetical protein
MGWVGGRMDRNLPWFGWQAGGTGYFLLVIPDRGGVPLDLIRYSLLFFNNHVIIINNNNNNNNNHNTRRLGIYLIWRNTCRPNLPPSSSPRETCMTCSRPRRFYLPQHQIFLGGGPLFGVLIFLLLFPHTTYDPWMLLGTNSFTTQPLGELGDDEALTVLSPTWRFLHVCLLPPFSDTFPLNFIPLFAHIPALFSAGRKYPHFNMYRGNGARPPLISPAERS